MKKIKYAVLLMAAVFGAVAFLSRYPLKTSGQVKTSHMPIASDDIPDGDFVDRFDLAMQHRFLTQPNFGARRIGPTKPEPFESAHVGSFHPVDEAEKELLSRLETGDWRMGIYLYGKRANPREDKNNPLEKFNIRYRVNQSIPVTWGLKRKNLPGPKKLMKEVKDAFLQFQAQPDAEAPDFRFAKGDWTFVARPVRAVNQSCVACHTDYVVTAKLDDGMYQFRKRQVGDVNGVIVYGFSKKEKND